MTLLEMTIVILVLLSLVGVTFINAHVWKKGADKSNNVLNIRNIQQSVRGHQNMLDLDPGNSSLDSAVLFLTPSNKDGYLPEPKPPETTGITAYTYLSVVPEYGRLYVSNLASMKPEYVPDSSIYSTW